MQCSNPVPNYWDPPLCGGHCDNVSLPEYSYADGGGEVGTKGGADGSCSERIVEEGGGDGEIESASVKEEGGGEGEIESAGVKEEQSLSSTDGVANRTIERTADTCTRTEHLK